MEILLAAITKDLTKTAKGNKAASQRVRTNSIKLEKVAKKYRKESISEEKQREKKVKSLPKKNISNPKKAKSKRR